jgi:hypothetical protein
MLSPGYVIKESSVFTNLAPSVGICTDGFGGFAKGIRVFANDQDADKFIADMNAGMKTGEDFGYQRIVAGVYYWWQDT